MDCTKSLPKDLTYRPDEIQENILAVGELLHEPSLRFQNWIIVDIQQSHIYECHVSLYQEVCAGCEIM